MGAVFFEIGLYCWTRFFSHWVEVFTMLSAQIDENCNPVCGWKMWRV